MVWWKPLLIGIFGLGSIHALIKKNQGEFDRFVMGIVRDVGRHKAKKRRNANTKGLMTTLLHQDDPLQDLMILDNDKLVDEFNLPTYTETELFEFGNGLDDKPILISIFGRVYDVSAGERFYGQGGPYANFAGHDITYSLCTGCRTDDCLTMTVDDLEGQDKMLDEGKRWLSFFHLHDKYPLVGKMESDYFETLLSELIDENELLVNADGEQIKAPILN